MKGTEHRISSVSFPSVYADIEEYSQEQIMLVNKSNPCKFKVKLMFCCTELIILCLSLGFLGSGDIFE